jgi:hypothetical protein
LTKDKLETLIRHMLYHILNNPLQYYMPWKHCLGQPLAYFYHIF